MEIACDLIVLGGGPAGAECALAAAAHGLDVVLIDEAEAAGGQVWRAPATARAAGAVAPEGAELRERLGASRVRSLFEHRVWSISDRFQVAAVTVTGAVSVTAPRLVAATGAGERVVPFPGWTLPGIVGLAGATILLKSHGVLPGRRVIVAGAGPLLAAVAAGILAGGGHVVAIVDAAPRAAWLRVLPVLARRPALAWQALPWLARIAAARVPLLSAHSIVAAEGEGCVRGVTVGRLAPDGSPDGGSTRGFAVDAVCVGEGLVPGGEVARLLRATCAFDRRRGGWIPDTDPDGRTSVPGLFAIGDGAGIRGALPAVAAGRLAGLAVAADAGRLSSSRHARLAAPHRRRLARLAPFADAMADLMALRPGRAAGIGPQTIVCRCEDVTRAELDDAVAAGAQEMNQVKAFTRCGMGPCGGRICGDVAAEIVAARVGSREAVGFWTGRPPLRPVPLGDLVGTFDYADIPIPPPAPL